MATDDVTRIPARAVLEARLEEQRDRIFRAEGICGLGALTAKHIAETKDHGDHGRLAADIWTALEAARAILDEVAGELEPGALFQPRTEQPS